MKFFYWIEDCVLHDIKVQSKGPDDIVYDNNSAIRTKV
jgi:hypothetical protein